jgi:hypothetical protein
MSTVSNLITESMRRNGLSTHTRYAAPVITDVEAAAEHAAATIRSAAVRAGIERSEVDEVLISAGLVERPTPPPAPQATAAAVQGGDSGLLERLVAFAERHGFRG